MKYLYLILAIPGLVLPYGAFIPWLVSNGVDPKLMAAQAFENNIAAFAWLDVIVAAVVLLFFIMVDGKRNKVKSRGYAVIGTLCVGVSFGLPLYLYLREKQLYS